MSEARRPPVLITIGDPNGVGPEIAVKAAVELCADAEFRPLLIGERYIVEPLVKQAGFGLETAPENWGKSDKTVDLYPVDYMPRDAYAPGTVCAPAGQATVNYVKTAITLMKDGTGRGIVGCPHSETAVNASGRVFSGYPNLLSELLGTGPDSIFLMLVGGGMRIVHVTLHEGINTALKRLTPELIERAVVTAEKGLRELGIAKPRIGLFGINPHASENGLFGDEDRLVVKPAVERMLKRGLDVVGPEGADTMLVREGFDAFVAMYHDQGHIPVKLVGGREIAAVSIGGGALFSSVGHGAAFDIAGQNTADPAAVLRAIKLVGGAR
ncbi:MAG: 4-hydroxythreonine-4-phosphate dehydrogenase PdxA [Marinosulfonomonas sp.]|nr:4-hydroxythreonine-4-phosphate dehydrogenase PdxA [Marinosulfonomonas sp.]